MTVMDGGDTILPVMGFLGSSQWDSARWQGTTFRWHPTGAAPPVMGLVFANADAGRTVFGEWVGLGGNRDPYEELSITIVEGPALGDAPGYLVHLGANAPSVQAHAAAIGAELDPDALAAMQIARKMDLAADTPPMLERFKREYARYGEFLLAPVTARGDGGLFIDVDLGIVKTKIAFLTVGQIIDDLRLRGLDADRIARLLLDPPDDGPPGLAWN
ncbi:MAG: hypothetical protein GX591_10585 [Planctomycetes bacterium]|nr:hypothetical protein [Planctomycetota bacterium]